MRTAREVVFITGAGSGLGKESALALASHGYAVYGSVLNDSEAADLEADCRSRGVAIQTVRMDVTEEAKARAAVDQVIAGAGRIDALVHFAGIGLRGFFEDLSAEEIRRVYEVNVFGTMNTVRAVLPHMRQAGRGRIVITSSIGGRMGSMTISGYASSKFAVEGFAECLYQEVYPLGIHVSLLEPGLVATPHFTVNRNRAKNAVNPASPYHAWFCQHEHIVDKLLAGNRSGLADVAQTVLKILKVPRPRLRYVVGWKAKGILSLRRHVPGELFQNVYWAVVRKMVTRPRKPCEQLSSSDKPVTHGL